MKNLNIAVVNCKATYLQRDGFIVCGNSGYTVTFAFDSEWDAHSLKTARFKWNNEIRDVVLVGNTAEVPKITNATQVEIGVYASDLCTTTPAVVPCLKSILCGSGTPSDPTPDVYSQIIELINAGLVQGKPGEAGKTPTFKIENDELKVSYDDGKTWSSLGNIKGADGDGKTPTFKIENDELKVSYDDKTWESLGNIKGDDGSTPTIAISDDGYWVINGVTTEHKAKGEDGNDYVLTKEDKESIASLVTPSGGGGSDHTPDGETLITDGGKTSVHGIYPKFIDEETNTLQTTTENNTPIGFFVGTQEAYDNLKPEEQANLFALIQDEDDAIVFEDLKKASGTKGLKYELYPSEEAYYCSGIEDMTTRYITIPPYHLGKPVRGISANAFNGKDIRSIVIPDTVVSIGVSAFGNCAELTSVTLGNGIDEISRYAFKGCASLIDVSIPGSCRYIYDSAFQDCTSLKRAYIPKSVLFVGDNAFANCPSLTIYVELYALHISWANNWNASGCKVVMDANALNTTSVLYSLTAYHADHAASATLLDGSTLIYGTFDAQGKTVTLPEDIEMGVYVAEARVVTPNTGTDGVISSALVLFNPSQDSYFTLTTPVMALVCRMHVYPVADKTEISVTHHFGEAQAYTINFFRLRRII